MQEALAELRWADLVDVLIVAAVIYAILAWLRRTQAALVALGIGILGAVYLAARGFELHLTTWAFQGAFAVSLFVLVVVFQEELRQAFEGLAAWALGRRSEPQPRLDTRDILCTTLFELARDKIGALIVLPGRQLLDRHLQGGVALDGRLSRELLRSLFDPHSEGHDGAVIVENRRVSQFGVHLPLTRSPEQTSRGTRHAAALGLSERTDALCLVASEERGVVSAAFNGRLRELAGRPELGVLLDRFYKQLHPLSRRRSLPARILREDRVAKAGALLAAAALWVLFVPGGRPVEVERQVPVHVTGLPAGLTLSSVEPPEVTATLRAPMRELLLVDEGELTVTVDASLAGMGRRTFQLSDAAVSLPEGAKLRGLAPRAVRLSIEER